MLRSVSRPAQTSYTARALAHMARDKRRSRYPVGTTVPALYGHRPGRSLFMTCCTCACNGIRLRFESRHAAHLSRRDGLAAAAHDEAIVQLRAPDLDQCSFDTSLHKLDLCLAPSGDRETLNRRLRAGQLSSRGSQPRTIRRLTCAHRSHHALHRNARASPRVCLGEGGSWSSASSSTL